MREDDEVSDWLAHPLYVAICIVAFAATLVISFCHPGGFAP
jgi:hypothetical protein